MLLHTAQTDIELRHLIRLLVPHWYEVAEFLTASLFLLFFGGWINVIHRLGFDVGQQNLHHAFGTQLIALLAKLSGLKGAATLVVAGWWAVTGLVFYLIVVFISNVVITARNDVAEWTEEVSRAHPATGKDAVRIAWLYEFFTWLYRVVVGGFSLFYLYFAFRVLYPFWQSQFGEAVTHLGDGYTMLSGIIAVLGAALSIYFMAILLRLLVRRERVLNLI